MLGILSDTCFDTLETTDKNGCLKYCDFVDYVRGKVGITGGLYANAENYWHINDALLESAYDTYQLICQYEYDLTILGKSLLNPCLYETATECVEVCDKQYSKYLYDDCVECTEHTFDDNEFLTKVITLYKLPKNTTRSFYNELQELFGWRFIYKPEGIYVVVNNITEYMSVEHMIPIPFNTELIPISEGC